MKKSLFRGFKPVFSFTAKQNIKSKGFLITTILIAIAMFLLPFGANIFMGYSQKDDNTATEEEVNEAEQTEETENYINNIYFVNNTAIDDSIIKAGVDGYSTDHAVSVAVKFEHNKNEADILKNAENTLQSSEVIFYLDSTDDEYTIKAYIKEDEDSVKDQAEQIGNYLTQGIPTMTYASAGLDMNTIMNIQGYHDSNVTKAGDAPEEIGTVIIKMLLPMMVGLLMYILINMNAQSVTKIVIAEKTSKLMETLLTSAMPYGIIAGKILAVTAIAILQIILWAVCLVAGFVVGNVTTGAIWPGYDNMILKVIDMIKDSASTAFSIPTVIIAIVMVMLGFLFYCVYAGLVGTFVQKAEDLGVAQIFLVIPLIASWLVSYMAPAIGNETLLGFVRFFPLTAPFSMPADVIVGNVGIAMSLVSMLLLLIITVLFIILTGYFYKKRIFK